MRRDEIISQLGVLEASMDGVADMLRGSLLKRETHHSKGCAKCARGEGHTLWVLSVNYPGGKNRQISVRPEQVPQIREALARYRKAKETLEEICELNQRLLLMDREESKGVRA